jgi:MarR family transcriptional regulator, lower aerobic nicotinate degradation pathway regulator
MDYDFLKALIEKAEEYELNHKNRDVKTIEHFSEWLSVSLPNSRVENVENEGGIGQLIGLMYRYAKNYSKKALKNTPIQTIEEFTYMASLMEKPLTKTQVIDKHAQEKTTGMAIIQRLLRQGWIMENKNEADGRSQIIAMTDLGHNILRGAFSEMGKVSRIVTAHLSDTEKAELMRILIKLDTFHRTIFDTEKTLNLDTIIEKYKI